jgi:hypothetical protein
VRGPADLDPMMPVTVTTFLMYVWSQESERGPSTVGAGQATLPQPGAD